MIVKSIASAVPVYRSHYQRTAGHPPANTVPLRAGYNEDATPTPRVTGFGVTYVWSRPRQTEGRKMLDQEEAHRQRRVGGRHG